jgi:predicted nucleotidyltransferase
MANKQNPVLRTKSLGSSLFGKTREAVIGLLFTDPDLALHVREIARRTGFSAPTVARELRLLEDAGVLVAEESGRQVRFRADAACPLFGELKSIAVKTWGIRGRILSAIESLPGIECAFIFGSFASGGTHRGSDVDVLVIGSIDHAVLSNAMTAVSSDVGRRVNAQLYRPAEWRRKLDGRNSFLESVAGGSKIFLLGDEEVLNDVGKPRASRGEKAAEPPSAYGKGNRKPSQSRPRVRRGGKPARHA